MIDDFTTGTTRILITAIAADGSCSRSQRERRTVDFLLKTAFGAQASIVLRHEQSGAPTLEVDGTPWHISISHSRTRAAVALDRNRAIGIDIEEWREQLRRVTCKYLRPEEIAYWAETPGRLLQAWMAKEAAYKAFSPRGVTLLSIELHRQENLTCRLGSRVAVMTIGPGYALAIL